MSVALLCIAKAPVAGRVKTRLCPPCTPDQAARIAEAALADTLDALHAVRASRRVLVLDGDAGPWLPDGFDVVPQGGGVLGERLAAAFEAVEGPALLVGMDTPQLAPAVLVRAAAALMRPGVDAVLGPAVDGGYWAIGLRSPDARVFGGVPMSSPVTLRAQRARLRSLGLRWRELPRLHDVDDADSAGRVAALIPGSRFAAAVAAAGIGRAAA